MHNEHDANQALQPASLSSWLQPSRCARNTIPTKPGLIARIIRFFTR